MLVSQFEEMIDARIARGIALLDAFHGEWWPRMIDVESIDFASLDMGIPDQLYRDHDGDEPPYRRGIVHLGLQSFFGEAAHSHGFVSAHPDPAVRDRETAELQDAWKAIIQATLNHRLVHTEEES